VFQAIDALAPAMQVRLHSVPRVPLEKILEEPVARHLDDEFFPAVVRVPASAETYKES
jgi:hypothetical protein